MRFKLKQGMILSGILVLLSLKSIAQSTSSYTFTIQECVNYALEHQNDIKMSRFDEYIAEKKMDELMSAAYPQVAGSINLQGNIQRPQFIFSFVPGQPAQKVPVGQPWQHTAGVNLSQLIFDWRFFIGLDATKAYGTLSEMNTKRTEDEVINQVVTAYYNALTAKEGGKLLDINLERLQKLLKDTDALYKNGLVEKMDIERIQISINNIETEKVKFGRMLMLSVDVLKFQMGMPVNNTLTLEEEFPELDVRNEDLSSLTNPDFSKRREFSIMKQQALLESYNRKQMLANLYPNIYGFAYYQFNMQGEPIFTFAETGTFSSSAAGLKINIPIFDGFQTRAKVQQSDVNLKKISLAKEMLENGLSLEMNNAIATLKNSRDTYKFQEENVQLARSVFEKAQLKYKEGVGSSLEVNNAEVAVKEALQNLLAAKYEYLSARLKIQSVKGELRQMYAPEK